MADETTKTPTTSERRAAAEEALRKADDAKAKRTEERELAILELRAKYTAAGGTEGEDFAVYDAGAAGPIVLKLPATGRMVMLKRFRAPIDDPKNGKITIENSMQFVTPCVDYPAREVFLAACEDRPAIAYELANELHAMLGKNEAAERGK
jgi:hypothetical protein